MKKPGKNTYNNLFGKAGRDEFGETAWFGLILTGLLF